jgi:hypothetical protein
MIGNSCGRNDTPRSSNATALHPYTIQLGHLVSSHRHQYVVAHAVTLIEICCIPCDKNRDWNRVIHSLHVTDSKEYQ